MCEKLFDQDENETSFVPCNKLFVHVYKLLYLFCKSRQPRHYFVIFYLSLSKNIAEMYNHKATCTKLSEK